MNIFDLFIYAIAAFALIGVFLLIAQNFPPTETPQTMMKKALEEARLDPNLGQTYLIGALNYEKDNLITSTGISPQGAMTSIECTNPIYCCVQKSQQNTNITCDKSFEWDYDFVKPREARKINTFARCIDIEQINTCKIYIGSSPAQAEVFNVENIGENSQGNTEIKATLINSGATTLANGNATIHLYKKNSGKWKELEYDSDLREVTILQPQEKQILYWEIKTINLGEYKAEVKFEAQNAGFDSKGIDFNKTQNNSCNETTIGETVYNAENNNYEELHYCEGCNYAYECANAWGKRDTQTTYYPKSSAYAYCVKQSADGSC